MNFIAKPREVTKFANDILVQNIVAHIANPTNHIKIIGTVVDEKISTQIAILDTVNRLTNNSILSSKFLLALLHSKLLNWYVYRFIFAKAIRTMHFDAPVSDKIPIRAINFADKIERAAHDKMVALVEQMLDAKKHLQTARTDKDKTYYQDRCNALDRQIDKSVYELYGLTGDKIKLSRAWYNRQAR